MKCDVSSTRSVDQKRQPHRAPNLPVKSTFKYSKYSTICRVSRRSSSLKLQQEWTKGNIIFDGTTNEKIGWKFESVDFGDPPNFFVLNCRALRTYHIISSTKQLLETPHVSFNKLNI